MNRDHARARRPSQQELADEIAREERRLAELIEEAREARTRLEALHADLTASKDPEAARAATPAAEVGDHTHIHPQLAPLPDDQVPAPKNVALPVNGFRRYHQTKNGPSSPQVGT